MLHMLLEKLFQSQSLSQAEAYDLFSQIMRGELSNEQLTAVLIALKMRGETAKEISGAVNVALNIAAPFPRPDYDFADIVGTGGDGQNTINISTASSIVAASMGYPIAKHGSRGVSSQSGASDVLSALGIDVSICAETARQALDNIHLCFLFAPNYHSGFRFAAPVRQALKTRTIFNLLGPLVNPARPTRQLLGVYAPDLISVYAETVVNLGHKHSIVVHGSGLDEVAIHGMTEVAEIKQGQITYYQLTPEDFGLSYHPLEALRGDTPLYNAQKITELLQGKGEAAHIDAVAANVAMVMRLFGEDNLKQNAQRVKTTLASGVAFETLQKLAHYR